MFIQKSRAWQARAMARAASDISSEATDNGSPHAAAYALGVADVLRLLTTDGDLAPVLQDSEYVLAQIYESYAESISGV